MAEEGEQLSLEDTLNQAVAGFEPGGEGDGNGEAPDAGGEAPPAAPADGAPPPPGEGDGVPAAAEGAAGEAQLPDAGGGDPGTGENGTGAGDAADTEFDYEDAEWRADLNEKTAARVEKLLADRTAAAEQHKELQGQYDNGMALFNAVQQSNLQPQEFNYLMGAFQNLRSGNPQAMQQGFAALQQLYENTAQQFGSPTQNFDPVSQFPDLQQRMKNYEIDHKTAQEIATGRMREQLVNQQAGAQQQQQAAQAAVQRQAQEAAVGIKAFEADKMSTDPDYRAKEPHIVAAAQRIMNELPPNMWAGAVQREYQSISAAMSAAAAGQRRQNPTPLRPASGGTDAKPEPGNLESALTQGLAAMRAGQG